MRASLVMALSSTRSLSRMSISARDAPFSASCSRRMLALDLGRGGRLALEALDVGKPESEIDHFDGV